MATKTEQAQALFATASDTTATRLARVEAIAQIREIKTKSKMSWDKLGVDADLLAQVKAALEGTESTVETTVETTEAPAAKGRKHSDTRATALKLLDEAAGKTRKEKIELLMEKMSITKFNAAYYVDRVAK